MANLVLVEKIENLISEIDKYIKSNKDWVFYFLNPLAGTDGANKPLFDCMEEHPGDWEEYIDFVITDVSESNVRINIKIDDDSDFGIELKRYIFLPHFEESVLRNKKIYEGNYNEIRIKNIEDDINELKSILEKKEIEIANLKEEIKK